MKTVLTIAGSDASGGAGIQADIKTLTVHKVYATSCITALTAQNTKGITGIMPVPPDFFEKQMDSVFSDIKPDAVKIGMIASKEQVEIIAKYLQKYSIKQVVADPVMISTSGTVLVEEEVREILYEKLFPNISLLTPNLPETEFLSERKIAMLQEGKKAPLFTLPDQDGNLVNLSDFAGKKIVLYFYPRDNTPGCTRQACAFAQSWED